MVLCMGLISSHLSRKSWNKMYFCFSGSSCILCICDNSQSTGRKTKSDRVCCFKDKVAKPKTTKEWVRGCVSVVGGDLSPFINFICAENSVMHQNITRLADYIDHDVFHSFPQWILLWMLTMVFGHHFERNCQVSSPSCPRSGVFYFYFFKYYFMNSNICSESRKFTNVKFVKVRESCQAFTPMSLTFFEKKKKGKKSEHF